MNPEAQRIAIAEACGWTEVQRSSLNPNFIVGRQPKAFGTEGRTFVPDHLSDLNAMHEAEKCEAIRAQGLFVYCANLATTMKRDMTKIDARAKELSTEEWMMCCITATAAQRAEAFLRTLNLWKD